MAASADFDPIVVDATLTPARALELVSRGRESAKLDYKAHYSGSTADKVENTKDIVAMANTAGGYLVFGVEDDGTRTGLTAAELEALDEAKLRAQVQAYVGTSLEMFVDLGFEIDSMRFAILTVLRSPRSPVVFERDGAYPRDDGKGQTTAFRTGEVWVRHGAASERWNQNDVQTLYARVVERERERWLAQFVPDVRRLLGAIVPAQAPAFAPRDTLLLDAASFEQAIAAMVRARK